MKTPETDLPTPRTAAKDKELWFELPSTCYREMKDFARELERENAGLLALLRQIEDWYREVHGPANPPDVMQEVCAAISRSAHANIALECARRSP